MKANRFLKAEDDEAVSPVIAVILMVAITVVLAATVYVWVSGFGTSGSIKKFPQVTMKDASDNLGETAGQLDALVKLEHRGGDPINWDDYTLKVFKNGGTTATLVEYDDSDTCASATSGNKPAAASGTSFGVGDAIYLCEDADADFVDGDRLKLQVIDNNQNSIVYENEIVVDP